MPRTANSVGAFMRRRLNPSPRQPCGATRSRGSLTAVPDAKRERNRADKTDMEEFEAEARDMTVDTPPIALITLGPRVCGLAAGGNRIRTISPA